MANPKKYEVDLANLKISIPEKLRGGKYANTINIAASSTEVTLNFIYLNPTDEPQATLVSRVIVPPAFLENLAESIDTVIKEYKNQGEK